MRLVSVYDSERLAFEAVLFDLLRERAPETNISHQEIPTWDAHVAFVRSRPYEAWYLIEVDAPDVHRPWTFVGAIYLTRADEIGAFVFARNRGKGHASAAIRLLMLMHQRERYLANINPRNKASIALFTSMGFRHIQSTYELRT